ncbi:hypothetical protein [Motilimonas pumila]|uniref:Uncharacterized protein n=1 Tax=Motilimonas pumila TaxID=2303987 RepID=A0A418YIV7_9GAMM|nr:hypothetical protein [Motilimonas pumila]RJG50444.1 hypothetical protein D1Z90_02900 [Motilimonas pumila]
MFAEIVQWTSLLSLLVMVVATVYFSLRNFSWINQAPLGYQGCHPSWRSFSGHQNWQLLWQISLAVIASRLLLFAVVQIVFHLIHPSDNDLLTIFRDLWYRWDTNSFLSIADNGYVNEGKDRLLLVFYPLYPVLVHLMTYLIPDTFFAAVAVSNICLILACFTLFKLVMFEFHQRDIAAASVKYLLNLNSG